MKIKKIISVVAVLILIAVGIWFKGYLAVDSCLDSGGRWNYDTKTCEH